MLVDLDEHKGKLVRDTNSMAILNVDKTSLLKHKLYEQKIKREQELESKINTLQTEVSSIKITLDKVLELLNSNRGS